MLKMARTSPIAIVKPDGEDGIAAELGEHINNYRLLAGIQLGLVDAGDLVGDTQHGGAAREDFIAQEGITLVARLWPAFQESTGARIFQ